jgi:hypothetical protein
MMKLRNLGRCLRPLISSFAVRPPPDLKVSPHRMLQILGQLLKEGALNSTRRVATSPSMPL